MLFKLCNVFDTFQFFINEILREYLNKFCTTYLNNILIYSDTLKKYIEHIKKILIKLKKIKLYLDINKCKFSIIKIKYLNQLLLLKKSK